MPTSKGYSTDVRTISSERVKGRMNTVKARIIAMIKLAHAGMTVIDEYKLKTWDIDFPLATVKLNISEEKKLSYGNKLPDGTRGQYFYYRFTIHVFTVPNDADQLKAKDAQEIAEEISKYFRRNNKDSTSGILDIMNLSCRESDPEPHGTRRMVRVIITGDVLCERPWGTF
jgi:hypothetical protein